MEYQIEDWVSGLIHYDGKSEPYEVGGEYRSITKLCFLEQPYDN